MKNNPIDELISGMGVARCPKCSHKFKFVLGYVPVCPNCKHEIKI
jgi:DNA-directed RNA polymerase subunit RPC12/RpoP